MLDERLPLLLITAKLAGSSGLEVEITSSTRRNESTTGFFHFPVWDLLLPLAQTDIDVHVVPTCITNNKKQQYVFECSKFRQ